MLEIKSAYGNTELRSNIIDWLRIKNIINIKISLLESFKEANVIPAEMAFILAILFILYEISTVKQEDKNKRGPYERLDFLILEK